MNNIDEHLTTITSTTNRPWEEVLIYNFLEAVLRRLSRSIYAKDLVLRGGMLTRLWVTPEKRVAVDVDFLGLYEFDIEVTRQIFLEILSINDCADGVTFYIDSLQIKGIWLETEFPGMRVNIDAALGEYQRNIQIDIGFGDPLVLPPEWINYPTFLGDAVNLQAVRPETMVGWKIHGLVELGPRRWRPKDLYDLLLYTEIPLDDAQLSSSIAVAFSSRNTPLQDVLEMLVAPDSWNNSKGRSQWKWYQRKAPTQTMPEDFLSVVTAVTNRWYKVTLLALKKM
jgi:predicted nucleotidyltransferase component of viral defense system